MPDQAVIDGSIKQGPALSATSDLPNINPAVMPEPAPVASPPASEPAAGPASGVPDAAGQSPDGTGAPSGDQPQLPLEEAPQPKPDRLQPRL